MLAIKDAPREVLTINSAEKLRSLYSGSLVGAMAKTSLSLAFKSGSKYVKAYGLKFDGKNAMVGDTIVSIRGNDLWIGCEVFEGTVGLWEPENFEEKYVANYVRILRQTKAHLKQDGTIKAKK